MRPPASGLDAVTARVRDALLGANRRGPAIGAERASEGAHAPVRVVHPVLRFGIVARVPLYLPAAHPVLRLPVRC